MLRFLCVENNATMYLCCISVWLSFELLPISVSSQLVALLIGIHYMVSEVGWLAFACSHLPRSISRTPMNGRNGSAGFNSSAWHLASPKMVKRNKSVRWCTAWGRMQRTPSRPRTYRKIRCILQGQEERYFRASTIQSTTRWISQAVHHESLQSGRELRAYCDLKAEMVRDQIVVGIRDSALLERLQLDPDLTLQKAKTLVRQREAVHE